MAPALQCNACGKPVSEQDLRCPSCGARVRYKTAKEAYGTWAGLGVFDLIPGIRDLPYPLRFALMLIAVVALVIFVVPWIIRGGR